MHQEKALGDSGYGWWLGKSRQELRFACDSPGCFPGHVLVRGASVSLRSLQATWPKNRCYGWDTQKMEIRGLLEKIDFCLCFLVLTCGASE